MPGLIRLLVLWCLLAMMPAFGAPPESDQVHEIPVRVVADAPGATAEGRLRIEGGQERERSARLQFELPPAGDQRWVLWLARDPLDRIAVAGKDWAPEPIGFFQPPAGEGAFAAGFGFPLPRGASGPQELRLDLQGSVRSAPAPRVLSEQDVLRYVGRETALAYAVYAALATLLIATLALYSATRDRLFLRYVVYVVAAAALVAAANGHLFAIPGLRALGARALWLAMLAFNAIALSMLLHFADARASGSPVLRRMYRLALVMWVLVLLPLLPAATIAGLLQVVATGAWVVAMPVGIWAMLDGARRGVPMALAVAAALLALLVSAGAHEAMHRGWVADGVLARHGYQFALVLMSVILFVGLSSRLGLVRQRLEDEASARRDSELRLRQEQLRAGLARALQESLRDAGETDVAPRVFRQLGEHAEALLGIEGAVVLADGCLGHGPMQVPASLAGVRALHAIQDARAVLRGHAMGSLPVHVRLDGARGSDDPSAPLFAIVPLRMRAPAWAALVVPLAAQPLDRDALQALEEFSRIAVASADEGYASLRLRHTAEHDALTGSQNRRSLDQWLLREFSSMGGGVAPMAVLFIDIDLFKQVNDTRGHACGDECLRVIAATLRSELRPCDVLGRYGGEEFLVLLPGQDAAAARVVAERLRQAVESTPVPWQDGQLALTVSIGLAARREQDADSSALLARADKALYLAKHEGRNCVRAAPAYSG